MLECYHPESLLWSRIHWWRLEDLTSLDDYRLDLVMFVLLNCAR